MLWSVFWHPTMSQVINDSFGRLCNATGPYANWREGTPPGTEVTSKVDSHRSELMENWASERKILTLQNFDSIRNYLGEKATFSFAWIQFYIRSFLCLFILAFVVSLIPVFLRSRPLSISKEVCMRDSTPFIMCPPCKAKVCRFRRLNKSCGDIIWTYFFDSPASVVLAFIAPIFGSLCLQLWTYRQSALAHRWHMQNYKVAEKPARRHFIEMLNPVHRSPLNTQLIRFYLRKESLPLWSLRVLVLVFTWSIAAVLIGNPDWFSGVTECNNVVYPVGVGIAIDLLTDMPYMIWTCQSIIVLLCNVLFNAEPLRSMQFKSPKVNRQRLCGLGLVADILAPRLEVYFMQSESRLCSDLALPLAFGIKTLFNVICTCILSPGQQAQSILTKSCLMEFSNVFLPLFISIIFRALNYGYLDQNSTLFEPLEWPIWTGMFGVFYEVYIRCALIVFVKSATDWLPLSKVMKVIEDKVCSLVFCRQTPPEWVKVQSPSSSPTYNHCLDNFDLDPSGEHLLFQRQLDM
ncbi:unnamed protein product [Taenia asiatica]|uniref:Anoctamin n=1 Tax=Taenia asiatica TaxID=60517 RepID=A0A158RAH2_TAEAS|nr:unnamed protein product [Taenia asiatica]